MIKLRVDSLDKYFQFYRTFGQVTSFPDEMNFDSPLADTIQPIGNVKCTAITTCDIANDQDGIIYDYDDLFSRIPHTSDGAEPRKGLSEAVKNGLRSKDGATIAHHWSSYWRADEGNYDAFDNVRSSLIKANSPVGVATYWYNNWRGGVLPMGENIVGGHMYSVEGWKQINGEPHLIIQAWTGSVMYMPRKVFNRSISYSGCGAWVLSTYQIDQKFRKNIWDKIFDAIRNILLSMKDEVPKITPAPVVEPTKPVTQPVVETSLEKLYSLSKTLLKKHLTLDESVDKKFGCAQALSYVLKEFGYNIPAKGISSTNELKKWLDTNMKEINHSEVGAVIINVSYTGKPGMRGHCGIVGQYQNMSNDSTNGLWSAHWDKKNWLDYYENTCGIKAHYYIPK